MFPEKVTYPDKYNLRPIVDPDGQFSAENANHIKEKINKNALFHGVHDNLAALQAAWQNPTPGHFAYLLDGTHYRCVNVGWTTNEAGGSGNYFFGYHLSMEALEIAHPNAIPGARAIIKVVGGNDLEALWDEDDQHWFSFAIIPGGVSTDPYQALKLGIDNLPYLDLRTLGTGSGSTAPTTRLESIVIAKYPEENWKYHVTVSFIHNGISYNDTRAHTLDAADALYGRFDTFAINLNTLQSEVIKGQATANPPNPEVDLSIYLDSDRFIFIPANAVAPANVTVETIYAENAGVAGGEWSITPTYGPKFDVANTENPKSGQYAIKALDLINSQAITFVPENPVPVANAKFLAYDLHNIVGGAHRLMIQGARSNGRQTSYYLPDPATFGYTATNNASYQSIILPITSTLLVNIENLKVIAGFAGFSYYIDNIRILSGDGAGEPVTPGNYATVEQVEIARLSAIAEANAYTDQNAGGGTAPIAYADMAALYAGQATQIANGNYRVDDASAHPDVNAGRAWFDFKGVEFGDHRDYILKSEEESLNLDAQLTALQNQITANANAITGHGTRLGVLERDPIIVSTSRLLEANDHNRTLLVTANVTLTWPAGGITPFRCNFDIDSTGQLLIADQAGTAGADLDAPDGKIAEAGKMTHCYKRPENIKLRLKGTWKV